MKIELRDGLPFVAVSLIYQGQSLTFAHALLDTGSVGTIFSADRVLAIGLQYEPHDMVHRIRGVGGVEFVFTKQVDCLQIGEIKVRHFEIEVGTMDYGLEIEAIIGMDFLTQVKATMDLGQYV